ncbi:hypothetical protein PQX77_006894 [Marasmius sp. AFHP31]|nr:hypothetical protein PQX77_006894 [Marasmius sp. AFHP31]
MFDLKKVFEKKFDGTGFLQWYQPTFKGVAMAEKLYDNLTGVEAEPKMPRGPVAVTGEGDDQVTVYALILVQAIPKVWEAAASNCLHDYSHLEEVGVDDKASSHSKKSGSSSSSSSSSSTGPAVKPALTLDCVQDAIMVEYECLNPQFAGRLTAVKRGGTNAPSFQQQQHPCPPQHQQQRGQQQQQKNQQQRAPLSNQDKGKKKKQQQ